MPAEAAGVHARLEAWRRQGADRLDPLRFALMAALAQRAARHDGAVRQRLDARLRELADAYAGLLAHPRETSARRSAGDSPLKSLLDRFDDAPRLDAAAPAAPTLPTGEASATTPVADVAPMPVLDEFQQLWSRIRIDGLLRRCLDGLPEDAGPLHSSVLTYRAMALMRDVSPDYLQHFVAYADALTWLEQLCGSTDANETAGPRRPARTSNPRRRKSP